MNYVPVEPQGSSAAMNWANKTHREVFVRKRPIVGPNLITSNTTRGIIHRAKDSDERSGSGTGFVPRWG